MTTLREFLAEHATFPFPHPVETEPASSTDISLTEVGLLENGWKAQYAVRDDTLVHKLCSNLDNILGETPLADNDKDILLSKFGRRLQINVIRGTEFERRRWAENGSEAKSRQLLDMGFFEAMELCVPLCSDASFMNGLEERAGGGRSKVDYIGLVNDIPCVLSEAKSPSVMKRAGDQLPLSGFELPWNTGGSLIVKIFQKAALYLGLRKMEWLFLTCHNYWIICRLVRNDVNTFLAYSSKISIENSTEPFRAFLGAILSIVHSVPVEASEFNPDMKLDDIPEEEDDPSSSEHDNDHSGTYRDISRMTHSSTPPVTHSHTTRGRQATESGLLITTSSPHSPASFQVWMQLHPLPNNTFSLPLSAQNGKETGRLWLTHFIGGGSTGNVWQCHFDNSGDLFAVKIVELLRRSDVERRKRFRNEFEVYLTMEKAYQSGNLCDRITPHCYGAFEGDRVDALILELCDCKLNGWDELNLSERIQVFKLARDLHKEGIVHDDLEPWNVARARGGGFRLIDFSESRKHVCKETLSDSCSTLILDQHYKCSELQLLRNQLRKLRPSAPSKRSR